MIRPPFSPLVHLAAIGALLVAFSLAAPDALDASENPAGPEVASSDVAGGAITVDFDSETGFVHASLEGEPLWRHRIARSGDPGRHCDPWVHGDRVYYAWGLHLWETSVQDGRVISRTHLDGPCTELLLVEGEPRVRTRVGDALWAWEREHSLSGAHPRITLGFDASVLHLEGLVLEDLGAGLRERFTAPPTTEVTLDAADRRVLSDLISGWQEQATQDPTNPWLPACVARAHALLGDHEAARAAARGVLETTGAVELVRVAALLFLQDPDISDAIFDRGLQQLHEAGYRSDLAHLMTAPYILLSPPPAFSELEPEMQRRWARRVEAVAPYAEGAWGFWEEYARVAGKAGDVEEAEWALQLAEVAVFTRHLGAAADLPVPLDMRLNLLLMLSLGLIGLALLHIARRARKRPWRTGSLLQRFNPLAWLPRSVTLGLALGWLLTFAVGASMVRDIAYVALLAEEPVEMLSGLPGHPASVAAWEGRGDAGPASREMHDFVHAIAADPGVDSVVPSVQTMRRAMLEQAQETEGLSIREVFGLGDLVSELAAGDPVFRVFLPPWLFLLLALLALGTPRSVRAEPTRAARGVSRTLDALVPGLDERLGFVGPLVFAGVGMLLLSSFWLILSGGATLGFFGSVLAPVVGPVYGLALSEAVHLEPAAWRRLAHMGWLLLALNASGQLADHLWRRRALQKR